MEKNPCTLPRKRRNKPTVFFLLLNSSSSSGEPESVLGGRGRVVESGGGGGGGEEGAVLPECLAIYVPLWGCTPRITEMVRSFFGCSLYILHMMYNQISLVTFNLILMTFQCKTCQIWYKFGLKCMICIQIVLEVTMQSYTFIKYMIIWQYNY